MPQSFELVGLDGANPLGFLAAVGTLVSLHETRVGEPRLHWKRAHRWVPILSGVDAEDEQELASIVADSLRGRLVPEDAEARRAAAQKEMELAKTAIRKKRDEIRKRGLRGNERIQALERELRPLEYEYEEKRRRWLTALREAIPRPELALGKRIDCTSKEYREHAVGLAATANRSNREALDLLASFGTDVVCQKNSDSIQPTPFCFITGSGHQFFLDTVRQLVIRVTSERIYRTLFMPWDYGDEGLSMRWDPIEDRRYALMDRDPTAPGNKPRTMWMANLLAYRALVLFPTAPVGRGLATAGWDLRERYFTWPFWECPLSVDGVRSLVQLRQLFEELPDAFSLRARGVVAVYRAQRVEVGTGVNQKVNFSAAQGVA